MPSTDTVFQNILAAIDFSPHAEASLRHAVWLARESGAKLTLAHALPDLRRVMYTASLEARMDLLYGEGNKFQQEIRQKSDDKMRKMIADLNATDLAVSYETLLGEPYVELTHAVQAEGYDLVMTGSRGLAGWETFFIGGTAKRLIRKCPASVWVVKSEHIPPPKVILAPTDFSEVSHKAVLYGLQLAQKSGAQFHLLHAIDPVDLPRDFVLPLPEIADLRKEVEEAARQHMEQLVDSLPVSSDQIHKHMWVGTPWKEIQQLATKLSADLITMGTVGRGGMKGLLLGNTAEKVLDSCDCSILTVKPDNFVCPIEPAAWSLHP